MVLFTPTPEQGPYLVAAIVAGTVGAPALADQLRVRLYPRAESFHRAYALVLWTIAAVAVVTLPLPTLELTWGRLAAGTVAGVAIGAAALVCDSQTYRIRRRARLRAIGRARAPRPRPAVTPVAPAESALVAGPVELTLVAGAEEILFRGVLVDLALPLAAPVEVVCLAGATLAFALVHATGGWVEVIAKGVLGALALAGVMATGTVVTAVVAHVLFNLWTWRARTRAGV